MRADLALIGFGNVGRCFARLLAQRRDWLALDYDLECRIVGIATRRHGWTFDADGMDAVQAATSLESAPDSSLGDAPEDGRTSDGGLELIRALGRSTADVKVLIETTTLDVAAGQPAIDYVRAGLQSGCDVVTANKGPVSFAYEELDALATDRGLSFLFEGAVMDGVPVFNLVRQTLPAAQILGFRGVINSTTNHVLTAIENGEDFDSAVARMQELGIAEADPSLDLDGWDAAAKTAALANVLMRARTTPQAVEREGIGHATARLAMAARARGRHIRLVSSAQQTTGPRITRTHPDANLTGGVATSVRLVELDEGDLLASLNGVANALILKTDVLGEIAICQLSGGLEQTAYALLSDLVTIRRRRQRPGPGDGASWRGL
jgi:homoserine dehydrogenase